RTTRTLVRMAAGPDKASYLYITTPAVSIPASMAIYDAMRHLRSAVVSTATGMPPPMQQRLPSGSNRGKRFARPIPRS
ncbi:ATP-dependent Clp protease proteolytic subunit, partial [Streptomyces sp. NRRL F-5122]|uniref:ATP-dependent Clp protease proteolytic subunit n=1 Tax=Streptomyces sp. NRRL F-5122 TaxID=1609098 RepID=UPI000A73A7A3